MKKYCILVLALFLLQNSFGKDKNSKELLTLEKALDLILDENRDFICKNKSYRCHLFLNIDEVEEYGDFKCYTAYFSNTELHNSILPSFLIKKKGVYCAIYLKKGNVMSRKKIPKFLFVSCQETRNEDSWMILICKNSFRSIVVNNGLVPYYAIKQFQNFSCDHIDTIHSKIEDGVVDEAMMDSIIKRW